MPLRIYNTATRDKEEFTPQVPGKVSQPRTDDYWGDPDQYQRMSY